MLTNVNLTKVIKNHHCRMICLSRANVFFLTYVLSRTFVRSSKIMCKQKKIKNRQGGCINASLCTNEYYDLYGS